MGEGVRAEAPVVSVVMAVRDVEDWISESIWSVLAQTESRIELLVIDDASTDSTPEIVQRLAAGDDRVKLLVNPGTGAASARNHGVDLATGEFVAFVDGDDIVPANAYEAMLAQARRSGSEMVLGNYLTTSDARAWLRSDNHSAAAEPRTGIRIVDAPRLLRDRVCWNRLIRLDSWRSAGIAFADSRRSNDIRAMVQCYCMFTFDVIPDVVYVYRKRVGDSSATSIRHRPSALVDHFAEEAKCAELLARLDDAEVKRVYYEGLVANDLWSHLEGILRSPSTEHDDYRVVRGQIESLLADVPEEVLGAAGEHQRLAFGLIAAKRWDLARLVGLVNEPESLRDAWAGVDGTAFITAAQANAAKVNGALTELVRATCFSRLTEPSHPVDDAELVELLREMRTVQRAGIPRGRLSQKELRLIDLPIDAGADAIRAALVAPDSPVLPAHPGSHLAERVRGALRRRFARR